MKTVIANLIRATISGGVLLAGSAAFAGGLEKVDIVREGIDQAPAIVRANANGYTTYENNSHKYYVRIYAKTKGNDRVYWIGVSGHGVGPIQPGSPYFIDKAGKSEGWATYSKSVGMNVTFGDTNWKTSPKQACDKNLQEQVNKGVKKSDVLKKEIKTTAYAILQVVATSDSKSNNKKNKHDWAKIDSKQQAIFYPINVVCRAAL